MAQKGYKPESGLTSNNPELLRENQLQAETGSPRGFKMKMDGIMPDIEYTTKSEGKIGDASPSSGTPLRTPIQEPTLNNPEANQHQQFVDEGAISHSPGAFNR